MLDTLLIITLFLIASLLVCLLTLRLSINIKNLCLFFHSLLILTDSLKFRTPPVTLTTPLPRRLLNLTKTSNPLFILSSPFIRHLRVWVIPLKDLKDKKVTTVLHGFSEIANESKHKPNKLWFDQSREFYNNLMQK